MPYFVFHLIKGTNGAVREADLKDSFPEYKDAKLYARNLRNELKIKDVSNIKIMFADHEDMAEAKLVQNRDAPILREWEK
jgi:hypothetical protein|tara:strand:- start:620 stop:859 length:240 start_codon:yes stop_codon:yes gene_type:complete